MDPIRFVFGVHLHQPVGNFDHVFEQHVRDVYRPLLERLEARSFLPAVLHVSGPLLEWLEHHDPAYLDLLGRLAGSGQLELLVAGFYEPVLASLPRQDRVEQIVWMREAIQHRFGVEAEGLWLTERVWEPELAADLAMAGVRYALVDDRHFLVTGFRPDQLHAPLWTESDGRPLALFPIDERLRYLIPFRPPEETAEYLRSLRRDGHRLAVLGDDGEKFGGWPGTREWVYERGWLDRFMDTIHGLIANGEVVLSTLRDALERVPSGGLAYLPTASYREMEAWSLPPDAAIRLAHLEGDLGEVRLAGPDGALVRGAHWRNFLVKYPESNRMHKKMQALSLLSRRRDEAAEVRRAIGRAQCNDAYWHGVFGGLYLPHLREAVWANLAAAEARLRAGETITAEVLDFDGDGHAEVWVHSDRFSAVISPRRGAAIEEYTRFASGINYADVLTRRREAYHDTALEPPAPSSHDGGGAPSIHDLEERLRLSERPPVDADERAILQERILPHSLGLETYACGGYPAAFSWARTGFSYQLLREPGAVELHFRSAADTRHPLEKSIRFEADGTITTRYAWGTDAGAPGDVFAVELSLFRPLGVIATPEATVWTHPVETVAKSERGLDQTLQGESLTLRWPVEAGAGSLVITA
jgi:alpha-amylase